MRSIIILSIAIWSLAFMEARAVEFVASAPSQVAKGDRFRLTYNLNAQPSDFNIASLTGFRVLSGPNRGSNISTQIVNGRTTQTVSYNYTYILEALQEGEFRIPPATATINGQRHQSNALSVKVSQGSAQAHGSGQQQQQQPTTQAGKKDVFVRATVSNPNPYQGEQVIVTYNIYTRLNIQQYSIDQLPSYRGFWSENITSQGQPQVRNQTIDGESYRVAEIRRVALYPQRSGELKIEPLEVEAVVSFPGQRQRQSLFDEFFGGSAFDRGRPVRQNFRSNALTLNVRSLPAQNRPAAFTGMVGTGFSINAVINNTELKVNDAANMKISISGNGNLRLLETPKIQFPPNLEVFDPNISDNIRTIASGMSGSRTYEYVMIPRTGGEFVIPPFQFVYFDPQKERYITESTKEISLNVSGEGSVATGMAEGEGLREEIRTLGTDIRFIKSGDARLQPAGSIWFRSPSFWLVFIIPFLLFAFFLIFYRKHIRLQSDVRLLRNRKAQKMARKRLKQAKKLLDNQNENAFYDEIFRTLWGYLSDKLSIPVSILNKDTVTGAFKAQKVSDDLQNAFMGALNDCEFARFAPGEKENKMAEIYRTAMDTIITIEKDLKSKKV